MHIPVVRPIDRSRAAEVQAHIDRKAKPVGALGRLERLAVQVALVRDSLSPRQPSAHVLVFAGDHGLTAEGVTAYPSDVTGFVAAVIADGRAGINLCARAVGIGVSIVDAGLLRPVMARKIVDARIGPGTRNSRREPAMTAELRDLALERGRAIASGLADRGIDTFVLGEIGIGNTSAAALVASAVTGVALADLVGPGAGLPTGGLAHKLAVLGDVAARAPTHDAAVALAEYAGFEMVMLTGAILGAAEKRALILIDGFIASACAAAAIALAPKVRDYCVFAHRSAEPGHHVLLRALDVEPLLDLDLRLGEGTGAALAVPLVRVATAMLSEMADLPGAPPS